MANVQGVDKIQDSLGYLVLTEEGAVISVSIKNLKCLTFNVVSGTYESLPKNVCHIRCFVKL